MNQGKYLKIEHCGQCVRWGYNNGKPWCGLILIKCEHDETACPEYKERQ